MSKLSPAQEAARRADGRFGETPKPEPVLGGRPVPAALFAIGCILADSFPEDSQFRAVDEGDGSIGWEHLDVHTEAWAPVEDRVAQALAISGWGVTMSDLAGYAVPGDSEPNVVEVDLAAMLAR